jgi:hypothetical protein
MTGLPRKEVQRLKQEPEFVDSQSSNPLSPLADLLSVWATSPEYRSADGSPLELRLNRDDPRSFSSLVQQCVGDVPPGAVRTELIRLGAVVNSADNKVRLVRRTLIPSEIDERLESALLYSLRGLAESIAHNNDPETPERNLFFERFVESRELTVADIARIRSVIRSRLTRVSEELDGLMNSAEVADVASSAGRIGVGLFYSEQTEN